MQILKDYEKYKLQWMLEHGYTLSDLLEKLAKIINEEMNVSNGSAHIYIDEAFEIFEKEQGFKDSEIWDSKEEWEKYKIIDKEKIFSKKLKKIEKFSY